MQLLLSLLGPYEASLDGRPITGLYSSKVRGLLAYLAVEAGRPHTRPVLAALLWPDWADAAALGNLRFSLSKLRQAIHDRDAVPPFLLISRDTIQLNPAADFRVDVRSFEESVAASCWKQAADGQREAEVRRAIGHLEAAVGLYQGPFLEGFSVGDSATFEEWALLTRDTIEQRLFSALHGLAALHHRLGDYAAAERTCRRLLALDPWDEEGNARLMATLAADGQRSAALRHYAAFQATLAKELGAEPASATRALHEEIRAGKPGAGAWPRPLPAPQLIPARTPSPASTGRPSSPPVTPIRFVAREDELDRLGRHLDAALAGKMAVAFVSGDAGSGKSALLEAFAASAMEKSPDLLVADARCGPGGSADPCGPLRRLAEMLFGDLGSKVAWHLVGQEAEERLQDATDLVLASLAEHGSGLIDALVPATSVARRAGPPSASDDNALIRIRDRPPEQAHLSQGVLFDQLLRTLAVIARARPLLLLLDDLHWVDEATAAFLVHLGRELTGSSTAPCRLLLLAAYRPGPVALTCQDPGGELARHPLAAAINELRQLQGEIVLDLDRADGRAFVEACVDAEPNRLGARFRDALYAHTDGHALFTVETLRNLQGRGALVKDEAGRWVAQESLDWGGLPAKVEAAIAERIDRLPEREHRILSAASVQGDDFSSEVVAELTGLPPGDVSAALSGSLARQQRLVRAEGLQRLGGARSSIYRFTHHLFQKYLYDELDPVERARWHAEVGASLDRQAGNDAAERERIAARLAWHYEAGGLPLQAARALHDAGRQATRVSAFREALNLLDHGLALLHAVDATRPAGSASAEPERAQIEQLLQIARLVSQRSLSGAGTTEVEGALAQVTETGAGALEDRTRLSTLAGETDHLFARGQFAEALDAVQRMLDLATRCGDDAFEAFAHFYLGFIYHLLGEPRKADGYLEWVLARHTPSRWAELRALVGFDLLPHALTISAINKFSLGYPDEALARSVRAVTTAQDLGDQYGLAFASAIGSMTLFLLRSDPRALQERSELCCRHCEKQGFAWWQYYAAAFLGWLIVVRGEPDEGIERMHSAMAAWQATGMLLGPDSLGIVLADAYLEAVRRRPEGKDPLADNGRAGLLTEGLARIDAVLAPDSLCGQCYQAELYRMRGELLLARDGLAAADEALACFERAMVLGRERGALAWELRAAMSIVRLRQRQGQGYTEELVKARAGLHSIYVRFAEGFAYPDLEEAAVLMI